MGASLLLAGGEDHHFRIPFMKRLRDLGFNVGALGSCAGAPFESEGFEFHYFKFERFIDPLSDWAAIGELVRFFADLRPLIVQSFDTKPNFLVPLAARCFADLAVIRTINGMGWVYSSRSAKALALRPVYRALHQLAARSAAMTVFQNCEDQEYFRAHGMIGSGSSQLIAGSGVDIEAFEKSRADGPSEEFLREQLRLGSAEVVLTVTRLTRQKGIPTLLKAAALVQERRPGVRFILAGPRESEGPQAVPQSELERHAPYVTVIGARSDVPSLLGIANVFAFPSEYREGVPRVLLEASLAGVPIVTTRMPGCSDVITDRVSGYLVPPRSPSELSERILDLLEHPESATVMGQRAKEIVKHHFCLRSTVAQYAKLYRELLATSRARSWRAPSGSSAMRSGRWVAGGFN
jgi:glycosyltransferase involved in cell wall biosynthesis